MNKKLSRLRYDAELESYCLEVSIDGGETWDLNYAAKLHRKEGESITAVPWYVSAYLINQICMAVVLGFELIGD